MNLGLVALNKHLLGVNFYPHPSLPPKGEGTVLPPSGGDVRRTEGGTFYATRHTHKEIKMPIRCEIVAQDKILYEGDVDIVVLPGASGIMGILPNHAPLLTTLNFGVVQVRTGSEEENFTVSGGVAEVQPDIVTVLADRAENVEEIDIERAEAAQQRAKEYMEKGPPPDSDRYLAMSAALRRSNLRLDAVRRYRRKSKQRSTRLTEE